MQERLPPLLQRIVRETPALARTYLVGGGVRDALLGEPVKDFDLEVFGVDYPELVAALGRWGRADLVGRSFGVVKLSTSEGTFDFSLPRRDSKTGQGHRGFVVNLIPDLAPQEAAARRDFTINAMMYDLRGGTLLDPFNGRQDLAARILRHTSAAFSEDPLRVLRGMQFTARFNLTAAPETVALCQEMVATHDELAVERRREEWLKWATQSRSPARGLQFLADTGWLRHYPELATLRGVPQDPEWHPEGDVWEHTRFCVDALVELPEWIGADRNTRIVLLLTLLLHDIGKAATTREEQRDGRTRIISPGHEQESTRMAATFCQRLDLSSTLVDRILPLVSNHMAHYSDPSSRAVRRLAARLQPSTIHELGVVMTADASGRPPLPKKVPETVTALLARAALLDLQAQGPRPILLGRHLIERGHPPGPDLGRLLHSAFEAQLDGAFHDLPTALEWLAQQRAKPSPGPTPGPATEIR